jgi:glucans biosynthesis protein
MRRERQRGTNGCRISSRATSSPTVGFHDCVPALACDAKGGSVYRRHLMGALAAAGAAASAWGIAKPGAAFSASSVEAMARALASAPFQVPDRTMPRAFRDLNYDRYRMIRFNEARTTWREMGLPFRLQFFHRGFLYDTPVAIHQVGGGEAAAIDYDGGYFSFPPELEPPGDPRFGFAGFRLLHPLNRPDHFDEVIAFLGASYFRALGAGHIYGISARALAIGTATPQGEEFPFFRSFWIERPAPRARQAVVHALLDSQSVTGAYRFTIRPGTSTVIDVAACLFPRVPIATIGLAPGTSMFLHGPNDRRNTDDFRPRVHDSDGLFMINGAGEEIWRPLTNPRTLQVSAFADATPVGFGLMQRERGFAAFQDLEARYHRRPGLWVEPLGDWGAGHVLLVEIPADREIHDNIVAFWRPAQPLTPGVPFRIAYRLLWTGESPGSSDLARFTGPLVGAGTDRRSRRFVLDAVGGRLSSPQAGGALQLDLTAQGGSLRHVDLRGNDETQGVRIAFELAPGNAPLVELRAQLRDAQGLASETWLYRWTG